MGRFDEKRFCACQKKSVTPKDLCDKPLIISHQKNQGGELRAWLKRNLDELNIAATYNLLFNASLFVDEGLGYAIGLDKIIKLLELEHTASVL